MPLHLTLRCPVLCPDQVSASFKPADTSSYTVTDVNQHFSNMNNINFASNTGSTYTCVDARGDNEHMSTPG